MLKKAGQYEGIVMAPGFKLDPTDESLSHLSDLREAGRLLAGKAYYDAAQGRGDEATDACIALCQFANAFPGENMIGGLVHLAVASVTCDIIARTQEMSPASPSKLSELTAAVSSLQENMSHVRALCGERAVGNYLCQTYPSQFGGPRFFWRPNYASYLELLRKMMVLSRRPFPEGLNQAKSLAKSYGPKTGPRHTGSVFARLLVPALASFLEKEARTQAQIRVLLASLAIRCARRDAKAFPRNLNTLVPKYLKAVPVDPFTGKPLRYRVDEGGCIIYSVGPDGVDDGGKGTLRISEKGGDIAVRIPAETTTP